MCLRIFLFYIFFFGFISAGTAVVYTAKKSITASARLLQPTALLPTCLCLINLSLVKNLFLVTCLYPSYKRCWLLLHNFLSFLIAAIILLLMCSLLEGGCVFAFFIFYIYFLVLFQLELKVLTCFNVNCFFGRLFWVDLIKWVSNVRQFVRVRPQKVSLISMKFSIVRRGRWVMHDGMQCDPFQGQGQEPFKVGNPFISRRCLRHLKWELATDHRFLNYGTISMIKNKNLYSTIIH